MYQFLISGLPWDQGQIILTDGLDVACALQVNQDKMILSFLLPALSLSSKECFRKEFQKNKGGKSLKFLKTQFKPPFLVFFTPSVRLLVSLLTRFGSCVAKGSLFVAPHSPVERLSLSQLVPSFHRNGHLVQSFLRRWFFHLHP